MSNVRPAEFEDMSAVLVLARKFFEVSGYAALGEFDVESCADVLLTSMNQNLCFVAEAEGEVVGFVLGASMPSLFNRNIKVGVELGWWVEPAYRNGVSGIRLLKAIESSAQEQGLKSWSMVCLESQDPEKVESMYLRMGYTRAERTFVRAM